MADSLTNPQIHELQSDSLTCTPFDTLWIPKSPRFLLLAENPKATGALKYYILEKGVLKVDRVVETPVGLKCGTFGAAIAGDRKLATGDFKGHLQLWDVEVGKPTWTVKAHSLIINSVDGTATGAPELVTGSRDGVVKVWDPRTKDPVSIMEPAQGQSARDCWTVAFGNHHGNNKCFVAGFDNGDIKMLDLRINALAWETNTGNGVCCLQFDRPDIKMNKLLATGLESAFMLYDMRTKHPTEGFASIKTAAHQSTIWYGRHLPQNRDLWVTCGGNGTVNLWKYTYPSKRFMMDPFTKEGRGILGKVEQIGEQKIGPQPVVSWDWQRDKIGLACCGMLNQTVKVVFATRLNTY